MELMCPHCHANNRVGAVGAAEAARYTCAGCGAQFEALLIEGALVPVLPREVSVPFGQTPADDFFESLSIPREPFAAAPAGRSPMLEDMFVSADELVPVTEEATPRPASAVASAEVDPFHITEAAEDRAAFPAGTACAASPPAAVAESAPAPVSFTPPPAPAYDKYAVGMRVLRISPMWLLLSSVGFFTVLLTMSWLSKPVVPVGEAVAQMPNQATSPAPQPAAVALVEQAKATAEKSLPPKPQASAAPSVEPAATAEAAAPAPLPPGAVGFGPAEGRGKYTVQVGSFNNPSEANEHVSHLRAAGVEARAVAAELPKRGTWYRVQTGRFETRDEAAKAGAQLRAKGLAAAAMVAEVNESSSQ